MISIAWPILRLCLRLMPVKLKRGITDSPRYVLMRNYLYDYGRFRKWAIAYQKKTSSHHRRALIMMHYHIVEKGLSFKEPRHGFGLKNVEKLLVYLEDGNNLPAHDSTVVGALKSLDAYLKFHEANRELTRRIAPRVAKLWATCSAPSVKDVSGGVMQKTRGEIHADGMLCLDNFFRSRHSIRHFGREPVSRAEIEHAILLATSTPSVCNRQAWRVHIFAGKVMSEVLRYQDGNRGFGDQASHVLIVTCDLRCFLDEGERNQAWVDGGMFAMSLVLALHSLGLGSCCLNISSNYYVSSELSKAFKIPEYEVLIMMIAVGTLPDALNIACSQRFGLGSIVSWHAADQS